MRTSRAGLANYSFTLSTRIAAFLLLGLTLATLISPVLTAHASLPSSSALSVGHTPNTYPHINAVHAYTGGLLLPPLPPAHRHHNFVHAHMSPDRLKEQLGGAVTSTISVTHTDQVVLVRRKSIAAKIRAAFHHLGHKIKHAFQKVGHAIVHVVHKVGHFIKTTGAKIAKVGLKIAATVGKVAGKAIGFIPGAKGLGKAIEGGSEGMNKASDAIHAHIGGKLGKAMKGMDTAQKVVSFIP